MNFQIVALVLTSRWPLTSSHVTRNSADQYTNKNFQGQRYVRWRSTKLKKNCGKLFLRYLSFLCGVATPPFFPSFYMFFWLKCRLSVILTQKMTKKAWKFDNVYTYHKDTKETTWYWLVYLNTANTDLLFCYILIDLGWPWMTLTLKIRRF